MECSSVSRAWNWYCQGTVWFSLGPPILLYLWCHGAGSTMILSIKASNQQSMAYIYSRIRRSESSIPRALIWTNVTLTKVKTWTTWTQHEKQKNKNKENWLIEIIQMVYETKHWMNESTNQPTNQLTSQQTNDSLHQPPNTLATVPATPEPEEEHEDLGELSTAPMAKRPCQCCCQTYSEILSFLEKRSEAEQRLREEELALRREELEIQRSMIKDQYSTIQ